MRLDVAHRRTDANCIHQKENLPINYHLTLKEEPKVKSGRIKRFPAHDFLQVGLPSQTCTTNSKRVMSTFKFGYPCLTLNEGSNTKRFPAHDFL